MTSEKLSKNSAYTVNRKIPGNFEKHHNVQSWREINYLGSTLKEFISLFNFEPVDKSFVSQAFAQHLEASKLTSRWMKPNLLTCSVVGNFFQIAHFSFNFKAQNKICLISLIPF